MFKTLGRPILLNVEKDKMYISDYLGPHLNGNDMWSFLSTNLPLKFRSINDVYTLSNVSGQWIQLKKYLKRGVSETQSEILAPIQSQLQPIQLHPVQPIQLHPVQPIQLQPIQLQSPPVQIQQIPTNTQTRTIDTQLDVINADLAKLIIESNLHSVTSFVNTANVILENITQLKNNSNNQILRNRCDVMIKQLHDAISTKQRDFSLESESLKNLFASTIQQVPHTSSYDE
jgi:hypothetical protein